MADCIVYTGTKQGQYLDWWWGPWNIHLPESQWIAATNVPPRDCSTAQLPLATQMQVDNSTNRSTTWTVKSSDPSPDIGATLISSLDVNFHAWSTLADDDHMHTTMNALDPNLPCNDTCHHDTGANHHVFHN